MRNRSLLLTLILGFGALIGSTQQNQAVRAGDDKEDRVGQLIKQLGSPKFAVRDRAKKELEALGTSALEALRQAAKSTDMETSRARPVSWSRNLKTKSPSTISWPRRKSTSISRT